MFDIATTDVVCHFDAATTCNWVQSTTDKFNWTVSAPGSTSVNNGPPTDHSGSGRDLKYNLSASDRIWVLNFRQSSNINLIINNM